MLQSAPNGAAAREEIVMSGKLTLAVLAVLFTFAGYEAASALNPLPPRHQPMTTAASVSGIGR